MGGDVKVVDGRWTYGWRNWLFRAKDGVIECKAIGGGEWRPMAHSSCPAPDQELTSRLPDLLKYWDRDA